MRIALIITAGGSSNRFGSNKLIEKINNQEIIKYTINAFESFEFTEKIITVSEELKNYFIVNKITDNNIKLVLGGNTRQESVFNGLKAITTSPDLVIIHDGARPLIKKDTIQNCINKAKETKASIVAVKAIDTIKIVNKDGLITETPNRDTLWCVQTPQIFDYNLILNAHKQLQGMSFSDDAGLLEYISEKVYISEGCYTNIKITTKSDLEIMKEYLKN